MLKITSVGTVGGDMFDIHLSNGNILMLEIGRLLALPEYASLKEDDRILYPKTDGECVYWRDGPRLTVTELLGLIGANEENKKEETR